MTRAEMVSMSWHAPKTCPVWFHNGVSGFAWPAFNSCNHSGWLLAEQNNGLSDPCHSKSSFAKELQPSWVFCRVFAMYTTDANYHLFCRFVSRGELNRDQSVNYHQLSSVCYWLCERCTGKCEFTGNQACGLGKLFIWIGQYEYPFV